MSAVTMVGVELATNDPDGGNGPYDKPWLLNDGRRDEVGEMSGDMEPTDGELLPPLPPECMLVMLPPLVVR